MKTTEQIAYPTNRPILYIDTVGGKQTCVDNLWAVTTDELLAFRDACEEPLKADLEKTRDCLLYERNRLQLSNDLNEQLSSKVCDQCNGDGWNYNRVEGQVACVCMTEAEPYQKLQEENEQLKVQIAMLRQYVRHSINDSMCERLRHSYYDCTCGLDDLLSATSADTEEFLNEVRSKAHEDVYSMRESLGADYNINRLRDLMAEELRTKGE